MKLNCLAIDDEPLALELISDYISNVPFLNLVKKCIRASDALEIIQNEKIDLIFLDIQMPNITGVQLLKSLQHPPMVIFTTAYDNYALEGYELSVIDYLMKPIPFERFLKAANKANALFLLKNNLKQSNEESDTPDYIFVKSNYQSVKIVFDDILFIEGMKDYVKIYCGERPVITLSNLKNFEAQLPPNKFIRVHKSYIVNISKIDSLNKTSLMIANKEIPIGANYKEDFTKKIHPKN